MLRRCAYLAIFCALFSLPSFATCQNARLIASANGQAGTYSYIYTPGLCDGGFPCDAGTASMSADADARFWALGFGDPLLGLGADSGFFDGRDRWLLRDEGYPVFFETNWGASPAIDGCIDDTPSDCTALVIGDQSAGDGYFALLSSQQNASLDYLFVQPSNGAITLAAIPQANASSEQLVGENAVDVTIDAPSLPSSALYLEGGCADPVVGYRVYYQAVRRGDPAPTDLERSSDWIPVPGGELDFTTATIEQITCNRQSDLYFAIAFVFDSGFETPFLGRISAPVTCGNCAVDADGDDVCATFDCNDGDASIYPGAPQLCDGINNDCDAPDYPNVPGDEIDADSDGFLACDDCDDTAGDVFPGAPELCNTVANDCDAPAWPSLPTEETDADGDGFPICAGDCDDDAFSVFPRRARALRRHRQRLRCTDLARCLG